MFGLPVVCNRSPTSEVDSQFLVGKHFCLWWYSSSVPHRGSIAMGSRAVRRQPTITNVGCVYRHMVCLSCNCSTQRKNYYKRKRIDTPCTLQGSRRAYHGTVLKCIFIVFSRERLTSPAKGFCSVSPSILRAVSKNTPVKSRERLTSTPIPQKR